MLNKVFFFFEKVQNSQLVPKFSFEQMLIVKTFNLYKFVLLFVKSFCYTLYYMYIKYTFISQTRINIQALLVQ